MARHRQPREIAELTGATKANSQRYKGEVIKSELPLGSAPEYMAKDAKAVWLELEGYSLPGVLTGSDRLVMEIMSNLIAEYRRAPQDFPASKHGVLKGHLATMGLNVSALQHFGAEKPGTGNPYDSLDQ